MSFFKSQNFFSGKIFNWRRLLLWGGGEYGGGDLWQHLCSRFEKKKEWLTKRITVSFIALSQSQVLWVQNKRWCDCREIWLLQALPLLWYRMLKKSVSLCLGFPICRRGGGGLCARLSLRPPKLKEILNSDLSLPTCQSAFRANRLAPLNGCFPHPPNWRYFIPERTVSSLTYPISFKVSPFYFEVQRKRRLCIMRMAPLKCSPGSCRLADSAPERGSYCDADVLRGASAARAFPRAFTVFLLLFIEHNVNEAINFTPHTRCRKKIMEIVNYEWISVIVIP